MKMIARHATRPKIGESVNGDAVVVRQAEKRALFAVVDALGHGPTAAEVAARAQAFLETIPLDVEVAKILTGLHGALRASRGAAAMICVVDGDRLTGCGVGNVELRVSGADVPIVLSPGVLGATVRSFRVFHGQLHLRSRIVLFSDGISARFELDSLRHFEAAEACARLLEQHGRAHDDATALVVDYER